MSEYSLESASPATTGSHLRVIDLRGRHLDWNELRAAVPRQAASSVAEAEDSVRSIIEDVRSRGAQALRDLAFTFDGVDQQRIRVAPEQIERAVAEHNALSV